MILCADSISKSFGDRRVLSAARLTASAGEIVGVLGRMGTGKSTLLKVCAGVLQPDSGWIELAGRQYHRPKLSTLARRGMFYLAEAGNLATGLTVRQHFDIIERAFGAGDRNAVTDQLQLGNLLDSRAETLSGGEARRVETALAMVRRPTCLLADEAFRGIDPIICELLGSAYRALARQGCAVVLTGHEVNTLRPYLDSVVWVTSGTTYSFGNTESAWSNEGFVTEYLGNRR
jgi:ABC-type multidrug transport system ATPase subunit